MSAKSARVMAPQRVVRYANKFALVIAGKGSKVRWLRSVVRDAYLSGWQDAASGVEFDAMGERARTERVEGNASDSARATDGNNEGQR